VLDEGARQHNCVGTLIPRIVKGLLSLYRANVLGQTLTVQVRISEQEETALAPFIALVQAAGLKAEAQWAHQPDAPVGETVAALGWYPWFDEDRFAALLPKSIHTWNLCGPDRCRCGQVHSMVTPQLHAPTGATPGARLAALRALIRDSHQLHFAPDDTNARPPFLPGLGPDDAPEPGAGP